MNLQIKDLHIEIIGFEKGIYRMQFNYNPEYFYVNKNNLLEIMQGLNSILNDKETFIKYNNDNDECPFDMYIIIEKIKVTIGHLKRLTIEINKDDKSIFYEQIIVGRDYKKYSKIIENYCEKLLLKENKDD